MTAVHEATPPHTRPSPPAVDRPAWQRALAVAAVAYVLSRAIVAGAAAAVAAARQPRPTSAFRPIIDVLTSWDGLWYLRIVRTGYPTSVPPHITFNEVEARAAFFPLYPMAVRVLDRVLPGGDVLAALFLNFVIGALFIYLVGVITRRLFGAVVAGRAMVLTALFPGSFVLSFTYSEGVMLVLAATCLLLLLQRRWLWAGVAAALCTASRPNAIALVAACAWAAFVAIKQRREWGALWAPLLSPIGFIAFQLYVGRHAHERKVWFRVQREAWNEGASYGWTAIRHTFDFLIRPFDSATHALTGLCVVCIIVGIWALVRVRLPGPLVAYTAGILALMLLPATVTARPRFVYTAFPMLIAFAAWWREDEHEWWALLLAACGAGLFGVVTLYGLFAAIP
jgi:hypothetical protein